MQGIKRPSFEVLPRHFEVGTLHSDDGVVVGKKLESETKMFWNTINFFLLNSSQYILKFSGSQPSSFAAPLFSY